MPTPTPAVTTATPATTLPPAAPLVGMPHATSQPAVGVDIRLRRILNPRDGRTVIVPLDHGMIVGPRPGIARPRDTIAHAVAAHADAVLLHAGLARHVAGIYGGHAAGLFKLTNGASVATDQEVLGSVAQALRYAADAVCVEFHLGSPDEMRTLQDIAAIQREAEGFGLPVIIHAYVYPDYEERAGAEAWLHAARIAVELGADIVKTAYLPDTALLGELVAATPVPVVVAGGAEGSARQLFSDVATALQVGVAGIAVGRRAWGAEEPAATMAALVALVHEGASVEEALQRHGLA